MEPFVTLTSIVAMYFIGVGVYAYFYAEKWLGISALFPGMLFAISAYMFYKYGFDYGYAAFMISLGISFICQGILKYSSPGKDAFVAKGI